MFHVLTPNSIPNYLSSGYQGKNVSSVLCGNGVGERREAISYEKANSYLNNGKLNKTKICKGCGKKLGIKFYTEDSSNV